MGGLDGERDWELIEEWLEGGGMKDGVWDVGTTVGDGRDELALIVIAALHGDGIFDILSMHKIGTARLRRFWSRPAKVLCSFVVWPLPRITMSETHRARAHLALHTSS